MNIAPDIRTLTNIELLTETGQAMEIDAVVVGDWGVYLIDVKGYSGTLEAGKLTARNRSIC